MKSYHTIFKEGVVPKELIVKGKNYWIDNEGNVVCTDMTSIEYLFDKKNRANKKESRRKLFEAKKAESKSISLNKRFDAIQKRINNR